MEKEGDERSLERMQTVARRLGLKFGLSLQKSSLLNHPTVVCDLVKGSSAMVLVDVF